VWSPYIALNPAQWVMNPFQIKTGANEPKTTRRKLALLTYAALGPFGSRWEQLPG